MSKFSKTERDAMATYEAKTWKATEPDKDVIEGTYLGWRIVSTRIGESLTIVVEATEIVSDGEKVDPGRCTIWVSSMIKRFLKEAGMAPGRSYIRIQYKGKEPTKSGQEQKTYAFLHKVLPEEEALEPLPPEQSFGEEPVERSAEEPTFEDDIPF